MDDTYTVCSKVCEEMSCEQWEIIILFADMANRSLWYEYSYFANFVTKIWLIKAMMNDGKNLLCIGKI